jgi:hypothetical protein
LVNVNQRTNGNAIACFNDLDEVYVGALVDLYNLKQGNAPLTAIHRQVTASLEGSFCETAPGSANCIPAADRQACENAIKLQDQVEPQTDLLDPKALLNKDFGNKLGAFMAEDARCISAMAKIYGQVPEAKPVAQKYEDLSQGLRRVSLLLAP